MTVLAVAGAWLAVSTACCVLYSLIRALYRRSH